MIINKKLQVNVVTLILLCLGLCITSFAISYTVIKIENNYFSTGEIKINLNNGEAIIDEEDPLFQPGTTVEKKFFIKNNGAEAIYYKLNFTSVIGDLSEVIEVTILDKNNIELASGSIREFEHDKELLGSLSGFEKQDLVARFHFPKGEENEYNEYKDTSLQFEVSAIAVQKKNNFNKEFE